MADRYRGRMRWWMLTPRFGVVWARMRRRRLACRFGREATTVQVGSLWMNFRYVWKGCGVTIMSGPIDRG